MTMNTIARIDSSNTRTTRGISDRTVCNTNREHKSCTLLSSSSSLCFSVFEKCEFLLSIEREKKRGKEGRHQNEQKTDRSSLSSTAQSRDDDEARRPRSRGKKSRKRCLENIWRRCLRTARCAPRVRIRPRRRAFRRCV